MKNCWHQCALKSALTLCALGFAAPSLGQYVWLDENGRKHYADTPPPTSVPANKIIKSPFSHAPKTPAANAETVTPPEKNSTAASPSVAPVTTAEKNADFQKRKIEQAEKEKKEVDESKSKADMAKNCERARNYQRILDSGQRISETDKNGERTFMSDEQRKQEANETKKMVDQCK